VVVEKSASEYLVAIPSVADTFELSCGILAKTVNPYFWWGVWLT